MSQEIRNVFISYIHEDDEGLAGLKELVGRHGLTCHDASITEFKANAAHNEDYIKYQILAPRINWASALLVYIYPETKDSEWVNWEIEYAHKKGKGIVGVWAPGAKDCEMPVTLSRYAHAVVGWDGASIIDAVNGKSNWVPVPDDQYAESPITFWELLAVVGTAAVIGAALAELFSQSRAKDRTPYQFSRPFNTWDAYPDHSWHRCLRQGQVI